MLVALKEYRAARQHAEGALGAFVQLHAGRDVAGAHLVLGMIFRETDRPTLAAERTAQALACLRRARDLYTRLNASNDIVETAAEERELQAA